MPTDMDKTNQLVLDHELRNIYIFVLKNVVRFDKTEVDDSYVFLKLNT